jgi:hypothetical protein
MGRTKSPKNVTFLYEQTGATEQRPVIIMLSHIDSRLVSRASLLLFYGTTSFWYGKLRPMNE